MDLNQIQSTNEQFCIRCGDPITLDNWSGWEAFLPDGKSTQAICKFCSMVDDCCQEKSES